MAGRLTKADVMTAAQDRKSVGEADSFPGTAAPSPTAAEASADGRFTRKKMSPLRRKIAQQLVMAQHTAAILTTFNECDMSTVQELRRSKQDEFTKKHGIKLGLMSFFVKAAVEALKAVPVVNGRIDGDDFIQNNFYDIGVAVGTERGLVVPVVRDADKKSFADLERDIADYAGRARDGKLKLEDLQGGTFTITNGGVYGSLFATPILNPPQSGILGMHKIMPRPMAMDGKVEVRPMMYVALSYDHRAIDGKEAVTFLIKVKECIEDPKKLPLDF
jgi:2-oxoglutarate dehydrogenase E2 component (dihydrolipoamide succinyltransferase)